MNNKFLIVWISMFLLLLVGVVAQSSPTDIAIHDMDVDEDGVFVYFTGENITSGKDILGMAEIDLASEEIGDYRIREIGDLIDPVSIDEQNGVVWIGGYNTVMRWSGFYSLNSLYNAVNKTHIITPAVDAVYREVVARPFYDDVVFTCRYDLTGVVDFEGVEVIKVNTSGLLEPVHDIWDFDCRGLAVDESAHLFVDVGQHGVNIYDIEPDHNLTQLSANDNRLYFTTFGTHWGRSDMSNVYDDYLFTTDGGGLTDVSENIQRINISNTTNPEYLNSQCHLDSSVYQSKVVSLEPLNESVALLVDSWDSSIYLCEFLENTTTIAVEIWDDNNTPIPFTENYGYKLEYWTDGGRNYFFTHDGLGTISMFELVTHFDEGLNRMPYFTTAIDRRYVDNLNPIASSVEPIGLETPVVRTYPLNCVSSLYECSVDYEGDNILFAVDPDYNGTFDSPDWWTYEGYSTTYADPGIYTMRIYLTDDQHPNVYAVYRDFTINVSGNATPLPENFSTLRFKVFDSDSLDVLPDTFVSISGVGNGYTNPSCQYADIALEDVYLVEFSKNGYSTKTNYYSTSPIEYEVLLDLLSDPTRRTLSVTVMDSNNSLLQDVFVQTHTAITNTFDYKYTDATGKVIFYPEEDNVIVVVDADGFEPATFEVYVPIGSTVSREVTLLGSGGFHVDDIIGVGSITGCQDYISGLLFCDYDSVSCAVDTDCLSGQCSYNGECSNFNWTVCDDNGMNRGNRCIFKYVSQGVLSGVGDWIVNNFFYVLIMVLILMGFLIFALKNK